MKPATLTADDGRSVVIVLRYVVADDNDPAFLHSVVESLRELPHKPYQMYAAIREDADKVLAVFP